MLRQWVLLFILFYASLGHAQQTCEVGSSSSADLAKIFAATDSTNYFVNNYKVWKKTYPYGICGLPSGVKTGANTLADFAVSLVSKRPEIKISRACVARAITATPGVPGYACLQSRPQTIDLKKQCYTSEMIDYLTWAYNMAIDCLSDNTVMLDPKILFMKINNESIFHYSVASGSGVGIGQVTQPAIDEMKEQGKPIIDAVLTSMKPSCRQFQKTLAKTKSPSQSKNYCPLVQHSEGLAYSVLYSVGYFKFLMQKKAAPMFVAKRIYNSQFYNLAALAMYNNPATGTAHVTSALSVSGANFKTFEKKMLEKNAYLKAVYAKANKPLRGPAGDESTKTLKQMGCSY